MQTTVHPGGRLWEVWAEGATWACDLKFHDGHGVEADIRRDDRTVIARRFPTRDDAEQWATLERSNLALDGRD